MIVIIAPEPSFWIAPLVEIASSLSEKVLVLAPWALRRKSPRWLPSPIQAFWNRRVLGPMDCQVRMKPSSFLWESASRLWAGQKTHLQMEARFSNRKRTDEWASRGLPLTTRIVLAPSCSAERTFAAAYPREIKTVLIEDLPSIRELHEDLDRAAQVHPSCSFLRRYRARPSWMLRQERERVLANLFLLRGTHARSLREELGISEEFIFRLPTPPPLSEMQEGQKQSLSARILLAGLATARNGVMEALKILEGRPSLTLLVRAGEGMEPADLLRRPQVREATRDDLSLKNVDLVLAPAWCESYSPELPLAAVKGIPIVATRKACGFVDLAAGGEEIALGDSTGLGTAVDRLLSRPLKTKALPDETSSDFAKALRGLLDNG